MRIVRHPILHQGTFEWIVKRLRQSNCSHPASRNCWKLVFREDGVEIYRKTDHDLEWLRERLDSYENYLYGSLAAGYCGRDGVLRPRTRDMLRSAGGFRQTFSRSNHK